MAQVTLPWTTVECVPEAGRAILVDGWDMGHCPQYLQDFWSDFATFGLPSARYTDVTYACEIRITGRIAQKRPYDDRLWVRVDIEWVKSDKPNTHSKGWMAV